ncbi:MAG: hypothetical protein ACRCX7_11410 [Cetobacterium sp.]|uniref:hypothetical protein n=1 Tax=Cetobacterium sp. TaxID=2071632 RepID=UPI003F3A0CBD
MKCGEGSLLDIYGVDTVTKQHSVANMVDLISNIDKLVEVGYDEYLRFCKEDFDRLERIIGDTMHLRNLFTMRDIDLQVITYEERVAYVRRSDLKVEIQFLETNVIYMNKLVDILRKINRFNDVKNERFYTPKELTKYNDIMKEER